MRLCAIPIVLLLCLIASVMDATSTSIVSRWNLMSAYQEVRDASSADSDKKARAFAAGLVAKITLEEKIGQMSQIALYIQHDEPVEDTIRKWTVVICAATGTAGAIV